VSQVDLDMLISEVWCMHLDIAELTKNLLKSFAYLYKTKF